MPHFTLAFPDYFDADAPIIEAKGYIADVTIAAGDCIYRPAFYDETRFRQEVGDEIVKAGFYCEE